MPSTNARHTLGTKIYVADPDNVGSFIQANECIALAALGQTLPLVKTTFSDALAETYIAGRPDGDEQTWRFNHIEDDPGQVAIRGYTADRENFELRVYVPSSPARYFGFEVTPLRAAVDPSNIDGQQTMEFRCKVSGSIDENASL